MSDKKQVKDIQKDHSDTFEAASEKLFGFTFTKFDEDVAKQLKTIKKSKEFLGIGEKPNRGTSHHQFRGSNQSFRGGPLQNRSGRGHLFGANASLRRHYSREKSFNFFISSNTIIIYLDGMLLMGASQPELVLGRDTLIPEEKVVKIQN